MNVPARFAMKKCLILMLNKNLIAQNIHNVKVVDLSDDFETASIKKLSDGSIEPIQAELLILEEPNEEKITAEVKNTGANAEAVERVRRSRVKFEATTSPTGAGAASEPAVIDI